MIIVSNTSPLLNLVCVGGEEILARLYGEILVPPAVPEEIA